MSATFQKHMCSLSRQQRLGEKELLSVQNHMHGKIGVRNVFLLCPSDLSLANLIFAFYAVDAANALPPSLLSTLANPNLYKGNPGTGYANPENPILCDFDTSKADRLFRLKYRSIEDCTRDMVADFARRGW